MSGDFINVNGLRLPVVYKARNLWGFVHTFTEPDVVRIQNVSYLVETYSPVRVREETSLSMVNRFDMGDMDKRAGPPLDDLKKSMIRCLKAGYDERKIYDVMDSAVVQWVMES